MGKAMTRESLADTPALTKESVAGKPTLSEYLAGKTCQAFAERPRYHTDGDFVTFFFCKEKAYERRVGKVVTVYRSMATNKLVGCKIKSVSYILKQLGGFGVTINDGPISLRLLFLGAAILNSENKDQYQDVSQQVPDAKIAPKELPDLIAV